MYHILLQNNRYWLRKTWLSPFNIWIYCVQWLNLISKDLYGNAIWFCWKSQLSLYFGNNYPVAVSIVFILLFASSSGQSNTVCSSHSMSSTGGGQQQFVNMQSQAPWAHQAASTSCTMCLLVGLTNKAGGYPGAFWFVCWQIAADNSQSG